MTKFSVKKSWGGSVGRGLGALVIVVVFAPAALARDFRFRDLRSTPVPQFECADDLAPPSRPTRLAEERRIVITTWNPENVEALLGKFEPAGVERRSGTYRYEPRPGESRELAPWKFPAKRRKIATAAHLEGVGPAPLPHFVITPEVESAEAAEHLFNAGELAGRYRTFLTPGNDQRRIDIAFAVRADLDVTVEVETHRDVKWEDPVERTTARVFTRDLPVLVIRDRRTKRVELILVGQHAKSMRDRAGGRDPNSRTLRAAQFQASRLIVEMYQRRFGADVPLILAGDFNADVATAAELAPVREVLHDAFEVAGTKDRITHTYHPEEGVVVPSQLDACFVSDSVRPFVEGAWVLPEFHYETGAYLGQPTSIEDRRDNFPSDHRALSIRLSGELFKRRDRR